ncbi:MAG TPA: glycogen debranching N-terminal domain-containing protein [Candidatus Eisenbacteria bacterium]|nr:glycogen debranching N-terminal domain-containing protein [Candidatus Eisenbacteria bacterium]
MWHRAAPAATPAGRPRADGRSRAGAVRFDTALARSIADAVTVKDRNVFLVAERDGSFPLAGVHGFGLYTDDTRYLDGCAWTLGGAPPTPLGASVMRPGHARFQLTNPALRVADRTIAKEQLGITWERLVDGDTECVHERLLLQSHLTYACALELELTLHASFEDMFVVRGMQGAPPGTIAPPAWRHDTLAFRYAGADGIARAVTVRFERAPDGLASEGARFRLELPARGSAELAFLIAITHGREADADGPAPPRPGHARMQRAARRSADDHRAWRGRQPRLTCDSVLMQETVDRSLDDLHALHSRMDGAVYMAAGLPWFATVFGRDTLLTAIEMLAWDPDLTASSLRLLAGMQGDRVDPSRDETPGKILHELRTGELARLGRLPHTPYYGSVDATPLFLVALARHARWTGSLALFRELRGPVERALEWIARWGDSDGDGFVDYGPTTTAGGLRNQGWKDSGDGIPNADGSLAEPPIALVEVQGYVYRALLGTAGLFAHAGLPRRARALALEAHRLRERFERAFWSERLQGYVLALERGGRPVEVAASNAGHALWSGIAHPRRAARVVRRLMEDDLWSGWGIRTLSTRERRFNPIGYHLGTVWPHDNALAAAGFRRYGHARAVQRVLEHLLDAALHFPLARLPELFGGYPRDVYPVPIRYPVACHPQAFAAAAVPCLIESALGLSPHAFQHRLDVVHPVLPRFCHALRIEGLRVGGGSVDVQFVRREDGSVHATVERVRGPLRVHVHDRG